MTDLPIRISQRVIIARPIETVFHLIRSPENPELDSLGITAQLKQRKTIDVVPEPDDPDAVHWRLTVTEMTPPTRLAWRTEYRSADLVIPGTCTYELASRGGGTVVKQTYQRPMPSLLYRVTLPLLWWKVRRSMRRRLHELKDILES